MVRPRDALAWLVGEPGVTFGHSVVPPFVIVIIPLALIAASLAFGWRVWGYLEHEVTRLSESYTCLPAPLPDVHFVFGRLQLHLCTEYRLLGSLHKGKACDGTSQVGLSRFKGDH